MRNRQPRGAAAAVAVGLGMSLLAGCSQEETSKVGDYLAQAEDYREQGRVRATILALKNALQQAPKNAKGRRLLGEAYLEAGNAVGAEKELRRSRELGVASEKVQVPLARALLEQGKHAEVLEELKGLGGLTPKLQAEALAVRGLALLGQEKLDAAEAAFARAAEKDTDAIPPQVGKARVQMARGRLEPARATLNAVLADDPQAHEGWRLLGHLERLAGRAKQAEAAFTMAIARSEDRVEDHLDRALVRVYLGDLEGVEADLASARQAQAGHPRIRLIQGVLHLKKGEYAQAQSQLEKALRGARKVNIGTFYLGTAHFAQDHWQQARQYLERFLEANPESNQARAMLASIALRSEEFARAESLLTPALENGRADPRLLGLMGQVQMATGRVEEGAAMLRRVRGRSGQSGHTAAGLALMTHGQMGLGVKELEKALQQQPNDPKANIGLVLGYLGEGRFQKAFEAAERVRAAKPGSPVGPDFMALALLGQGESERAFGLLEQVQTDHPGDPISGLLLGSRAEQDGKVARARSLYEEVLAHHPQQREAIMRLSQLEVRAGNRKKAEGLLQGAVEEEPEALKPRIALARLKLTGGQPAAALDLTEKGLEAHADNPALLRLKGRAQLGMERPSYAVDTFKRLTKRQPESVGAHYLLGRAHLQAEQPDRARQALEKAVALDPETPRPRLVLARLLVQQNRLDQAEGEIAQLRDAFPDEPAILDLAGELAYRQGDPAEAARIYGQANEVAPGTRFVTRKAGAQWAAGERTGSVATLKAWLEKHPEDATAQLALAQRYQNLGRVEQAVAGYRELLSLSPDNPVVHNNLAWLLRNRQPEEALHHVKRARELAPDSPEIQDTHAMILLDQDQERQAIRILRRVVERRPDNPTLRFHLAQALVEDGKRQAAREQLETVLSAKRRFPERKEAQALRQQLRP